MGEWQPIETAPYGTVVLVKNNVMEAPVRATRGYVVNGAVHADQTFFTSVYTPDASGIGGPGFPAGKLVCPTHWMPPPVPPEPSNA